MGRRSARGGGGSLPAAALIVGGLSACGPAVVGTGAFTAPSTGATDVTSGAEVERFFPLVDGNVYHYVSLGLRGEEQLFPARVFRVDATHGELRLPAGARRFEYTEDGVKLVRGDGRMQEEGFVLKSPLVAGNTWRGEHGGTTTLIDIGVAVDVPAGHFTGCLQTIEDRRGDRPKRYATTFCPDVGVVVIEVQSGGDVVRAELKSYGAPTVIGPDGSVRIQ